MQWWTVVCILAVPIGLFNDLSFFWSTDETKKVKLKVVRLLEGKEYTDWVKDSFEKQYPKCEIVFLPGLNAINESSAERFKRAYENKEGPVFFGGVSHLYNERKEGFAKLGNIVHLEDFSVHDPQKRWVGIYQSYLGIIWDTRKVDTDFVARSVFDLDKYYFPKNVLVPSVSTGASRSFMRSLGFIDGSFNCDSAQNRYRRLLDSCKVVANQMPESIKIVANSRAAIAVEWVHDAIKIREDFDLDCINISIPDESLPEIECVGVLDGEEREPYVKEFIKFVASTRAQQKHFESQYRLPVDPKLLPACLDSLRKKMFIVYLPREFGMRVKLNMQVYSCLKAITKHDNFELSDEEYRNTKYPGCK